MPRAGTNYALLRASRLESRRNWCVQEDRCRSSGLVRHFQSALRIFCERLKNSVECIVCHLNPTNEIMVMLACAAIEILLVLSLVSSYQQ